MGKNKKSSEEKKTIEISKPLLISIVVLIVIFIGSFVFFTFMFNLNKSKGNKVAAQQTVEKKELVNLGLGEEFVVNLADQGGKRYIKTNIVVAYNKKNKDFAKVAEEKTIVLRDATINYLKLKTVDETKDTEAIKKGLIDALNKALGSKDAIEDIYFQSLIVQ
ncbi:flagellar basal body-associated FliL family protein [Clostridium massiliamazoniense]|uniref:flagellar basal body-associated FliL family protein n=1 Tax=Clostridium massiliamazoniense TaxID=1347366 RepID=UPI0006D858E7|nr:flagellar basal body-associated FliL family protein [Clostridium massiliamazoniense]